jgi:RNA polymerase sigma-70 factor (ECF subfamily)
LTKVLHNYSSEEQLILGCKNQERSAQYALYQLYAGKMFSVCKRYLGNGPDAEDALMEGFMKVYSKMDSFQNQGSLEGWIRRIMANEALMKIRKNNSHKTIPTNDELVISIPENALMNLEVEDIEQLITELPIGYRTIFNLYAIEGYSHKEIATYLDISEGTSKSQLSRARAILQTKFKLLEA